MTSRCALICCDNFKATAAAQQVNAAIAAGLTRAGGFSVDCCALTDGGAGFLNAVSDALPHARRETLEVVGPLGRPQRASYLIDEEKSRAFVEMAQAAGIESVPVDELNPLRTTSYGVGQLLRHAAKSGVDDVFLGLGGSATNDAALGALQALGVVLHAAGAAGGTTLVPPEVPLCGGDVAKVVNVVVPAAVSSLFGSSGPRLSLVCDVKNPLIGPSGASAVYGPQKGATPSMVQELDAALARFGELLHSATGVDVAALPGAGAAGGMGGALHAVFGAPLVPGAKLFADIVRLPDRVAVADVVVTGEGSFDEQTIEFGKTLTSVIECARAQGKPVVVVCGRTLVPAESLGSDSLKGVRGVVSLTPTFAVEEAMRDAPVCIAQRVYDSAALFRS